MNSCVSNFVVSVTLALTSWKIVSQKWADGKYAEEWEVEYLIFSHSPGQLHSLMLITPVGKPENTRLKGTFHQESSKH